MNRLLSIVPALLSPTALVLAQDTTWLTSLSSQGLLLLAQLVPFLLGLALVVFVWGMVLFIARSGDEKAIAQGKQQMIWGVIGLFVLVSIWGFIAILRTLFGIQPVGFQTPGFM
jgi:hypothetical protein